MVAFVDVEQFAVADDLVQARGALQGTDFLEHALIVARTLHPVNHQLLAAIRQAIHLHGGIDDREQQRRGHDRETDEHQSAQ